MIWRPGWIRRTRRWCCLRRSKATALETDDVQALLNELASEGVKII